MVSYHSQLITSHNGISDVFKPPESCRSGWGQTDSQLPILHHSLFTSSALCQLKHSHIFPIPPAFCQNYLQTWHTALLLTHEWYCVVKALPIPAPLNGFNHWFRISYTVFVDGFPLPRLWTPWFPRLTCLEAAVEMSCYPSHGQDLTFILIDTKKMTWMELLPAIPFFPTKLTKAAKFPFIVE